MRINIYNLKCKRNVSYSKTIYMSVDEKQKKQFKVKFSEN